MLFESSMSLDLTVETLGRVKRRCWGGLGLYWEVARTYPPA